MASGTDLPSNAACPEVNVIAVNIRDGGEYEETHQHPPLPALLVRGRLVVEWLGVP